MNKKVIVIFTLTIAALFVLVLFSFGPPATMRQQAQINPASLQPSRLKAENVKNQKVALDTYHNRDLRENYYTVTLPRDCRVTAGRTTGSYALSFSDGSGSVKLLDIPDNTNTELFMLSHEEAKLRKSVSHYKRIVYKKISVNGNEGYELIYDGVVNGTPSRTMKIYITGPDQAGVITFNAAQGIFNQRQPVFAAIINSFQWENK